MIRSKSTHEWPQLIMGDLEWGDIKKKVSNVVLTSLRGHCGLTSLSNDLKVHLTPCPFKVTLEVLGVGVWSFKKSGSRKILLKSHGSRSLVFQRLCASRSLVFYMKLSRTPEFCTRLRVCKPWVVYLLILVTSFRHWILNFNEATPAKKLVLTSPKLSEFHKKLQNLPKRPFWCQKTVFLF